MKGNYMFTIVPLQRPQPGGRCGGSSRQPAEALPGGGCGGGRRRRGRWRRCADERHKLQVSRRRWSPWRHAASVASCRRLHRRFCRRHRAATVPATASLLSQRGRRRPEPAAKEAAAWRKYHASASAVSSHRCDQRRFRRPLEHPRHRHRAPIDPSAPAMSPTPTPPPTPPTPDGLLRGGLPPIMPCDTWPSPGRGGCPLLRRNSWRGERREELNELCGRDFLGV